MNTGRMGKGIIADHGLVGRYRHTQHIRYHPARTIKFLGLNLSLNTEEILPRPNRHYHFFNSSIARPLTNSVNRTFYLSCSVLNAG